MKKIAAFLRRMLLSIFLLSLLILCVSRIDTKTGNGSLILFVAFCSCVLYLLVSIISILVKLIRKTRMDERDAMMDAFTGVLLVTKNNNLYSVFRRISFWGTIMLLIHIFILRTNIEQITIGPYSSDTFLFRYHGFLLWSPIALFITFIVSILFFIFYLPHYGEGAYGVFAFIGKLFLADLATPIRIIKGLFSKNQNGKTIFSNIIYITIMIIFIVTSVISIIKTI